jgi:hypothetical protein
MKKPLVHIIILNWNGIKDTLECLASIRKINYTNYQVVVVDNGSKNNEGERIKKSYPNIKLIKNKQNLGFTGGNNKGIKFSLRNNAKYILLLNNDTIVTPSFLSPLVEVLENKQKIGAVSPQILYPNTNIIWSLGGKISTFGVPQMIKKRKQQIKYPTILKPDYLTGCCILLKSGIIKKIGLLDETFFTTFEDWDYSIRIKRSGSEIITLTSSIIYHKKSASSGVEGKDKITPFLAFYKGRNALTLIKKHFLDFKYTFFILKFFFFLTIQNIIFAQNIKAIKNYLWGIFLIIQNNKDEIYK